MKLQTFLDAKMRAYTKKKKQLKRKAFFLKAKIFLTCILPVVIILLAVKIIQTLLRMKLHQAASAVLPQGKPALRPVTQTSEKPEFVTPSPVSRDPEPQNTTE